MNQFVRFLLVGFANTLLGYGVIFSCMYLGRLTPEISNVIGYLFGLVVSYFMHRHITFRSVRRRTSEFVRFVIVFLVAYAANFVVLVVLVRGLGGHAALSQIVSGAVYVGTAYLLNKRCVFHSSKVG